MNFSRKDTTRWGQPGLATPRRGFAPAKGENKTPGGNPPGVRLRGRSHGYFFVFLVFFDLLLALPA
jgi:hypothetical protein